MANGQEIVDITTIMRDAFVPYALYTIRDRALVQYEDGLKPVQRRILWAMHRLGLKSSGPFRKVANVVGEVTGNFHPHGDAAVTPALVRMAQPWIFRVPLIIGKGNFGSMDKDNHAAMRYIEAKLSPAAEMMLEDTVEGICEFKPNYDQRLEEPLYLGSKFPNVMINGTYGIAVGIASVTPCHNPGEVCKAIELFIKNPKATVDDLLKVMPGPDWGTGGIVFANGGVRDYYETGKGAFIVQGKAVIESVGSSSQIVITELPNLDRGTNVGMSEFIESIVEIVEKGKSSILADSIEDIEDRSEAEGNVYKPNIIIKLKPRANAQMVLDELYDKTRLRINFNVNQNILFENNPMQTSMIDLLQAHIGHRRVIIKGRIEALLVKAEYRLKMVEACLAALGKIDEVIKIVRSASDSNDAKAKLIKLLSLDEEQAEYILNMQIRQLTKLQGTKLKDEQKELSVSIKDFKDILDKTKRIDDIIISELADIRKVCDCKRYTVIMQGEPTQFSNTDLIEEEELSVLVGHDGSINVVKRFTDGLTNSENERIAKVIDCANLDYLMAVTKSGGCYISPLHLIDVNTRKSHGSNVLGIDNNEELIDYLILPNNAKEHCVSILTTGAKIKTSPIEEFDLRNSRKQEAIKLSDGDQVVAAVSHRQKDHEFVIMSADGFATRYPCSNVKASGVKTQGVAGFSASGGIPVSLSVIESGFVGHLLFLTENGMGKKVPMDQIRVASGRISKGSNIGQVDKKTGKVAGAVPLMEGDYATVVTSVGQVIFYAENKLPEKSRYNKCEVISNLAMGDKIEKVLKLW